jgi:hypothetical protein
VFLERGEYLFLEVPPTVLTLDEFFADALRC